MLPNCEKDPILAAIDRVDGVLHDEVDWGQGVPRGVYEMRPLSDVRFCPMTALSVAVAGDIPLFTEVRGYFIRALPTMDRLHALGEVPIYNDRPERKFADIKALISKARALRVADLMKDKALVVIGPGRQAHY